MAAAGRAPRPCRSSKARRSAPSPSAPAPARPSASAPSYGHPGRPRGRPHGRRARPARPRAVRRRGPAPPRPPAPGAARRQGRRPSMARAGAGPGPARPRSPPPRRPGDPPATRPRRARPRPGPSAAARRSARPGRAPRRARPHVGIAAPSADEGEHGEGEHPRHRPRAPVTQRRGGGVRRLRPAPAVELDAGATGHEEQAPEIHPALGAVLEAGVEVAIDDVVAPHPQRPPHEVEVGAASVLLQPGVQGECQAALELRGRPRCPGEDFDRADVGQRVGQHLGVAELLAERECLGVPDRCLLGVLRGGVEVPEVGVASASSRPRGSCSKRETACRPTASAFSVRPRKRYSRDRERKQSPSSSGSPRAPRRASARSCAGIAASSSPVDSPRRHDARAARPAPGARASRHSAAPVRTGRQLRDVPRATRRARRPPARTA